MAIFGTDKKNKKDLPAQAGEKKKAPAKKPEAKKAPAKKPAAKKPAGDTQKVSKKTDTGASGKVLLRPRITEKAAHLSADNVYTFDVVFSATAEDVAKAIEAVYRVKPRKVNMVKTIGKRVRLRNRRGFGTRSGAKKAYVFLKKGDRIEFAS